MGLQAIIRALLYLGTIVFLGGGIFARWIAPALARGPAKRRVRIGVVSGGMLLVVASVAEAAVAMTRALGTFDAGLLPDYMVGTQHGRAVLARIALAVPLAWLAVQERPSARWDRAWYAALGLGLLVTFTLTSHAARMRTVLASVVTFDETVGPWMVQGTLTPRLPEGLEVTFAVRDQADHPAPPTLEPDIVLKMLDHPMSPVTIKTAQVAAGVYRKALSLPMSGRWQLSIQFAEGAVEVMLQAHEPPPEMRAARERANPIRVSPQSIARGRTIYQEECQACHGLTGGGDGPAAAGLNPRPADLRIHMAAGHTDGQLFNWVSEGFIGTAMPAFENRLSEDDRWHVINFLRTLVPQIR